MLYTNILSLFVIVFGVLFRNIVAMILNNHRDHGSGGILSLGSVIVIIRTMTVVLSK
jgi:hypothetical protein